MQNLYGVKKFGEFFMPLNVGFVYNIKPESIPDGTPQDFFAEFDTADTITGIRSALEAYGNKVYMIEANEEAYNKLKACKDNLDIVFNFAEGMHGDSREAHIPAMCEMLNIPYTGSKVLTMAITLDKARTKEILAHHGVPTPKFKVIRDEHDLNGVSELRYPLFIKPVQEGSSKGITNDSFIGTSEELNIRVKEMLRKYRQPVLIEEFLQGKEFTVGIIGNDNPVVLPIVEVNFDYLPKHLNKVDSYEVKWLYDSPEFLKEHPGVEPVICPARISSVLEKEIKDVVLSAYKALDIKDWCRIDVRLDSEGHPNIIEVNAIAGLLPDPKDNSRLPKAAFAHGLSFEELVNSVVYFGAKRYNLHDKMNFNADSVLSGKAKDKIASLAKEITKKKICTA